MDLLNSYNLTALQWFLAIIGACLVGFSKTGISGVLMLVIPIMASVFGGKESTGILLPMLLIGDIFAVYYYSRHTEWNKLKKPLPWALLGLILGGIVGNHINDQQFKQLIAVSILICLGILYITEKKGEKLSVPAGAWFYILTGIASGFTSMIGNAAGPIFSIYLLALGFKKQDFMGTFSWFFLIVNLAKLPIQMYLWNNITLKTILLAGYMLPAITIGTFMGVMVIKKLNEKVFRFVIFGVTALAAVRLLV